jgi:hypothetical protein
MAAPADPVLPVAPGLNRFVWDPRYPTTGVPGAHPRPATGGNRRHPGHRFALASGNRTAATEAAIL